MEVPVPLWKYPVTGLHLWGLEPLATNFGSGPPLTYTITGGLHSRVQSLKFFTLGLQNLGQLILGLVPHSPITEGLHSAVYPGGLPLAALESRANDFESDPALTYPSTGGSTL